MRNCSKHYDIAVVGGGLAGTVAALAAAAEGWRVAFIAPPPPRQDGRTTALLSESLDLLSVSASGTPCAPSAPLRTMRILDGTSRLFRAPPVSFQARAKSTSMHSATIFPTSRCSTRFMPRLRDSKRSTVRELPCFECRTGRRRRHAFSGRMEHKLLAAALAADGRGSRLRDAIGIKVKTWSYPQTALVHEFRHSLRARRHFDRVSHRTGPVHAGPAARQALKPGLGGRPEEVDAILALPRMELDREVEQECAPSSARLRSRERCRPGRCRA
jgi:2-octaprenyl-6-methoxyphenol hydroxylase